MAAPALLALTLLAGCDAGSADGPDRMMVGEDRALKDAGAMLDEQRLASDEAAPDNEQGDPGTRTAP